MYTRHICTSCYSAHVHHVMNMHMYIHDQGERIRLGASNSLIALIKMYIMSYALAAKFQMPFHASNIIGNHKNHIIIANLKNVSLRLVFLSFPVTNFPV